MDHSLLNISSVDGRYKNYTLFLDKYFSEFALMKYRLFIEIEYLKNLSDTIDFDISFEKLNNIYSYFDIYECMKIKKIEKKINHDVKSVEIYLQEKFDLLNIPFKNYIHFGLTSQDINNVSTSLLIKDYVKDSFNHSLLNIISNLNEKTQEWSNVVMLSRTHGQPAVPTTFGKEIQVFKYRLQEQLELLNNIKHKSKFGGAVGNFNAHKAAYPDINWPQFGNDFLKTLDLDRSIYTTQIDNYENLSIIFDNIKRINTILIDMCRDIWTYISMDYLIQDFKTTEVGSSTMPHKINPINFENAEGNLMISVNFLEFLSRKLPISRLQRDLTDSTVLRNLGIVFGYCHIAYTNIINGLYKLKVNENVIKADLNNNIVILTEGIQTLLRKYGVDNAYDKLKELSRNNENLTKININEFIDSLDLTTDQKIELKSITLENYVGFNFQ